MRESDDPLLPDRARKDDFLGGERLQGEEIERGDPGKREMVPVGHEVAREEERLAAVRHADRLRPAGVPLDAIEADPREDLDRVIDELHLAGRLERREVVGEVASAGALEAAGIRPERRPEELAVSEWVRLATELGVASA